MLLHLQGHFSFFVELSILKDSYFYLKRAQKIRPAAPRHEEELSRRAAAGSLAAQQVREGHHQRERPREQILHQAQEAGRPGVSHQNRGGKTRGSGESAGIGLMSCKKTLLFGPFPLRCILSVPIITRNYRLFGPFSLAFHCLSEVNISCAGPTNFSF